MKSKEIESEDVTAKGVNRSRVFSALLGIAAVLMCVLVGAGPLFLYTRPETANEFGDAFGFMNALVSGCAFTALIVTMFWQREELTLQRRELELTRTELKRSAEAQEAAGASLDKQAETIVKQCAVMESSFDAQVVEMQYERKINYKGNLAQHPSTLALYGIDLSDLSEKNVTLEQVSYLTRYLIHMSGRLKDLNETMAEHLSRCGYCRNLFSHEITRNTWVYRSASFQ